MIVRNDGVIDADDLDVNCVDVVCVSVAVDSDDVTVGVVALDEMPTVLDAVVIAVLDDGDSSTEEISFWFLLKRTLIECNIELRCCVHDSRNDMVDDSDGLGEMFLSVRSVFDLLLALNIDLV